MLRAEPFSIWNDKERCCQTQLMVPNSTTGILTMHHPIGAHTWCNGAPHGAIVGAVFRIWIPVCRGISVGFHWGCGIWNQVRGGLGSKRRLRRAILGQHSIIPGAGPVRALALAQHPWPFGSWAPAAQRSRAGSNCARPLAGGLLFMYRELQLHVSKYRPHALRPLTKIPTPC